MSYHVTHVNSLVVDELFDEAVIVSRKERSYVRDFVDDCASDRRAVVRRRATPLAGKLHAGECAR